jgi:hypothetical protein
MKISSGLDIEEQSHPNCISLFEQRLSISLSMLRPELVTFVPAIREILRSILFSAME